MEELLVCDKYEFVLQRIEKQFEEQRKALQNNHPFLIPFDKVEFSNTIMYRADTEYPLFSAIYKAIEYLDKRGVPPIKIVRLSFKGCVFKELTVTSIPEYERIAQHCEINFEDCRIETLRIELLSFRNIFEFRKGFVTEINFLRKAANIELEPFQAPVTFHGTEIGAIDSKKCQFVELVRYENCIFGENSDSILDFSDTQFKKSIYFEGSEFKAAPKFFNCDIHPDNDLTLCRFLDTSSKGAARAYGALRHKMMDLEADYAIQFFHSLELESRYKAELPPLSQVFKHPAGVEKIASLFLGAVNQYGRNLWWPLYWLLILAVIFCAVYLNFGGFDCGGRIPNWLENSCMQNALMLDIFMSVRNMMGPFGLALNAESVAPNTLFIKSVSFLQLMLSSLIWFIWILQIRSKFKI
jgi:hypothetical protein